MKKRNHQSTNQLEFRRKKEKKKEEKRRNGKKIINSFSSIISSFFFFFFFYFFPLLSHLCDPVRNPSSISSLSIHLVHHHHLLVPLIPGPFCGTPPIPALVPPFAVTREEWSLHLHGPASALLHDDEQVLQNLPLDGTATYRVWHETFEKEKKNCLMTNYLNSLNNFFQPSTSSTSAEASCFLSTIVMNDSSLLSGFFLAVSTRE